MSDWNFNMDEAPRGSVRTVSRRIGQNEATMQEFVPDLIIAAGNGGIVTVSKWVPTEGRWNMFAKTTPPTAWMPWPQHPYAHGEVTK